MCLNLAVSISLFVYYLILYIEGKYKVTTGKPLHPVMDRIADAS
jgi:hypothetical protein